jgi:hypothetical protein
VRIKVHKRHPISFIITILLVLVIALLAVTLFISIAKGSRLAREVAFKQSELDEYLKGRKAPISEESLASLAVERDKLKTAHEALKSAFVSPLNEEILEEELDPLKFKENLIRAQKRFREDAGGLVLPESLGFAKYETELCEPSDIPRLIWRLKVLKEVIDTAVDSKIESLDKIEFADAEDGDSYFSIPLSFSMNCTAKELVNFLYRLRVSTFNFTVEHLNIEKIQEAVSEEAVRAKLKTDLSVKAIAFN